VISLFTNAITLAAKCLKQPCPSQLASMENGSPFFHSQPVHSNLLNLGEDLGGAEEGPPSTVGLAAASGLAEEIKDKLIERFSIRLK